MSEISKLQEARRLYAVLYSQYCNRGGINSDIAAAALAMFEECERRIEALQNPDASAAARALALTAELEYQ